MPYQTTTERQQKPRSGVSLGGLGCGWFELRQDGQFYNWSIFNNRPVGREPAVPFNRQSILFFLVRYQVRGENPRLSLLQIEESHDNAGIEGHEFHYIFPWMQGVDRIGYSATFPFIHLDFHDEIMPLEVRLRAWSPFIPRNAKDSALPAAYFDFEVVSTCGRPVDVTLMASMRNCVGYDTNEKVWSNRLLSGPGWRGCEMSAAMNATKGTFGSMGLASLHQDSNHYCGWGHIHPYYERLLRQFKMPDYDDTAARTPSIPKLDRRGRPIPVSQPWRGRSRWIRATL